MSDEWLNEEADFERLLVLNTEERTEKANLRALPKTPTATLPSQPQPRSRGWRSRRQQRSRSCSPPSRKFDDQRSRSPRTESPSVVPKTPSRSVSPISAGNDLKRACEPTSSCVNDTSRSSEPPLQWRESAAKWKPPLTAPSQPPPQLPTKPRTHLVVRKESSQPPPQLPPKAPLIHLGPPKEPSSPPPANLLHTALDAVGVPSLIAKPPSQSLCRRTNKDGNPRPRGGGKNKFVYVPPRRQPNVVPPTHQPLVVPPKRQPHVVPPTTHQPMVVPPTKAVAGVWV
jgi:hypothetical protein